MFVKHLAHGQVTLATQGLLAVLLVIRSAASQASELLLETPAQPGELCGSGGEIRSGWAACIGNLRECSVGCVQVMGATAGGGWGR